ncbi:MAG: hypothetical protein R6V53_05170 [Candidatus Woesearchaeota archaeon]
MKKIFILLLVLGCVFAQNASFNVSLNETNQTSQINETSISEGPDFTNTQLIILLVALVVVGLLIWKLVKFAVKVGFIALIILVLLWLVQRFFF